MTQTADIVIIGGGCIGTSIAWQLARQGAGRVVLLEKRMLAAGASGRTGAIVRTHYTHPVLATMALHSRRVFETFSEVVGGAPVFTRTGFLALVSEPDAPAVRANVAMHQSLGIRAEALAPDDLARLEPRLTLDGIGVAAWEPDSGYADGLRVTLAYADAARREGVELRIGVDVEALVVGDDGVEGVQTSDGLVETSCLVVAAGYRTRDLLAGVGLDLPMTPVWHDLAFVRRPENFGAAHPVISDRVNGFFFRPDAGDVTRVGTTAPYDGWVDPNVEADATPSGHELARLADGFTRRFPGAAMLVGHGIACAYDCTPDLQPVLGPAPSVEGLYIAAGFSGHGFKLSPVVGELMAEKVLTGRTTLVDLDLFRLSRFAEGRPIASDHAYTVATLG